MTNASQLVLDHVRSPRNAGAFEAADRGVLSGKAASPVNLERVTIYLKVQGDRIEQSRFRASGCPALIASASLWTEMVTGRSRSEASAVRAEILAEALSLPPHQLGKAGLVIEAFVDACAKWDDVPDERPQDPG